MKKVVAVFLLIVLILVLWGAYIAYAVMTITPPVLTAKWGNVNEENVEVVVDAELGKVLFIPASVENLSIQFNGVEVASLKEFDYSPTKTNARIVMGIDPNELVRALERYFDNNQHGEASIEIRLGLFGLFHPTLNFSQELQQDILGQLDFKAESRPVFGGLLYTPPSVEGTKVVWLGGAENGLWNLKTYATLKNPNSFPIPVSNLEFEIFVNGIKVGGVGNVSQGGVTIPAGGVATVPIDTKIYSEYLPKVLVTHIKNGEKSLVEVNFYITVSAGGKSARMKLTSEKTVIQTDIMATINEALSNIPLRE
ncbi:LEA type 2 family protein [Thermococcus peptonophilus]|uniref:LEA type 2 family protein n=1 Tax=Thermococcus peptonophilus TaxID=53952 RepID=UPI0006D120BD